MSEKGQVIGQYFGIFHGCSKEHYKAIVDTAPFDRCNLLILAFVGVKRDGDNIYGPTFYNGRDNQFNGGKATSDDTDDDRIRLVVKTARAKNPDIKILISFGYYNEVVLASVSPKWFAEGLATLVKTYGLDGFDIDYELNGQRTDHAFGSSQFVTLMQLVKSKLAEVTPHPILTITPAMTDALDKEVLEWFTYVMPQSYVHGGNGTRVGEYQEILNSYDHIVYGLNGEGYLDSKGKDPDTTPDEPDNFVRDAKLNGAAGVFSWRLDTDSMPTAPAPGKDEGPGQMPTFDVANRMWDLMNRK